MGRRLRGAADGHRLLARLDGGADGDRAVVGAAGVLRELGRRADGPALPQRGDEGGVEPHPLAGQQVVVDRLAEQRVPEGVGAAARGHQDVGVDGGAQRGLELGGVEVGDGGQQAVADLTARDRDQPHDASGRLVEAVEVDEQHVGELAGDLAGPRGADELLDEEGVALGAVDDGDVFGLGERGRVERADEAAYVVVGERLDREPLDPAQAHPLRDLATERVAAVEVVGAVGHDERDARHRTGEEEAEHVAGGLVGPVGVLDHDEDRRALGDGGEEVAERVVDVAAVEGLVARRGLAAADPAAGLEAGEGGVHLEHAGGDVGEVGHEATEDLGEGEVGQGAVGEVEAVAGDDLPVGLEGRVAQGHQEAGLAHAGVAADEHGPGGGGAGITGAGPRGVSGRANAELGGQLLQLGIASDEIGGPQGRHGRHCVVSVRHLRVDRGAGHFRVSLVRTRVRRWGP